MGKQAIKTIFAQYCTLSCCLDYYGLNIGRLGLTSVQIEYVIEDSQGKEIFKEYATKAVKDSIFFIKTVDLPSDLEMGQYMFVVRVIYNGEIALAAYPFKLVDETILSLLQKSLSIWWIVISVLLIIALIMVSLIIIKIKPKKLNLLKKKFQNRVYNKNNNRRTKGGYKKNKRR